MPSCRIVTEKQTNLIDDRKIEILGVPTFAQAHLGVKHGLRCELAPSPSWTEVSATKTLNEGQFDLDARVPCQDSRERPRAQRPHSRADHQRKIQKLHLLASVVSVVAPVRRATFCASQRRFAVHATRTLIVARHVRAQCGRGALSSLFTV